MISGKFESNQNLSNLVKRVYWVIQAKIIFFDSIKKTFEMWQIFVKWLKETRLITFQTFLNILLLIIQICFLLFGDFMSSH